MVSTIPPYDSIALLIGDHDTNTLGQRVWKLDNEMCVVRSGLYRHVGNRLDGRNSLLRLPIGLYRILVGNRQADAIHRWNMDNRRVLYAWDERARSIGIKQIILGVMMLSEIECSVLQFDNGHGEVVNVGLALYSEWRGVLMHRLYRGTDKPKMVYPKLDEIEYEKSLKFVDNMLQRGADLVVSGGIPEHSNISYITRQIVPTYGRFRWSRFNAGIVHGIDDLYALFDSLFRQVVLNNQESERE